MRLILILIKIRVPPDVSTSYEAQLVATPLTSPAPRVLTKLLPTSPRFVPADVASAEADRDKALAEQRVAEERRTFAISEAAASVDASIQRVEASLERAARDRRARPAPEPAAQALAGGLCGLLLCDALHLDGIDLFGFLAGVGLMVAKLPSTSEKATS